MLICAPGTRLTLLVAVSKSGQMVELENGRQKPVCWCVLRQRLAPKVDNCAIYKHGMVMFAFCVSAGVSHTVACTPSAQGAGDDNLC